MGHGRKYSRAILWALFALYGAAMLYLLFFQRAGRASGLPYLQLLHNNLNLVPLKTIRQLATVMSGGTQRYSDYLVRFSVINLFGNVLVFIPLGLFLPCLRPGLRSFPRFLAGVAAVIVVIELIQLFTLLGSCDIDDLILNLPGAAVGYGIYRLFAAAHDRNPVSRAGASEERRKQ